MAPAELIVVGGGISGLALAWKAARAGRRVLVLEREQRLGGCIHSETTARGYWFELGAHTTYNSYGSMLDIVAERGIAGEMRPRGEARAKFGLLRDGEYRWLTPYKVLLQLSWLEAGFQAPLGILRSKSGRTMREYFSAIVGARNYQRILAPFLAAVPSQSADGFPAAGPGSLFKTRPRRTEFMRSFGFEGGLQRVIDAAAATPGITIERGAAVRAALATSSGCTISLDDGRTLSAPRAALATPVEVTSRLVRETNPALAAALSNIATVSIDSLGVVLPREKCWMPACAFLVPVDDTFFSCVTRDPFPDDRFRAFAFHFRSGLTREARLARAYQILRVRESDVVHIAEKQVTLPAPARDHQQRVAEIDRALRGSPLALTGNYFDGLAIEDCVLRSNAEWNRIA